MSINQFPYTFPVRLSEPLAITHVTVVPMDEERLLADHTVKLLPLPEGEHTSKELGMHWEVIIERPSWSTSMVFRLVLDGKFLRMTSQSCVWKPVMSPLAETIE